MLFKKKDKTEDLLELDREAGGGGRQLSGIQATIATAVALAMSLFAIYTNGFMNIQEIYRNAIFLGFIFILGFLLYPINKKGNKKSITVFDSILLIAG